MDRHTPRFQPCRSTRRHPVASPPPCRLAAIPHRRSTKLLEASPALKRPPFAHLLPSHYAHHRPLAADHARPSFFSPAPLPTHHRQLPPMLAISQIFLLPTMVCLHTIVSHPSPPHYSGCHRHCLPSSVMKLITDLPISCRLPIDRLPLYSTELFHLVGHHNPRPSPSTSPPPYASSSLCHHRPDLLIFSITGHRMLPRCSSPPPLHCQPKKPSEKPTIASMSLILLTAPSPVATIPISNRWPSSSSPMLASLPPCH